MSEPRVNRRNRRQRDVSIAPAGRLLTFQFVSNTGNTVTLSADSAFTLDGVPQWSTDMPGHLGIFPTAAAPAAGDQLVLTYAFATGSGGSINVDALDTAVAGAFGGFIWPQTFEW